MPKESLSQHIRRRVLIAHGDPGVRQNLRTLLASAGFDVAISEHQVDAFFLVQQFRPRIVIYELNLPQVQGHDFLALVRSWFPQISVVVMGSSSGPEGKVPDGVFADAMYVNDQTGPEKLLQIISELMDTAEARAMEHKKSGVQAFVINQRSRRSIHPAPNSP